ncbi:MAG TPA: MlaD family protein [Chitinophagaceae bacterium]|nr:MlaD family protein [Chitinophagaceae bacterium]
MNNPGYRNIKLGLFVLAGLLFLVLMLYMIGKNQNLFSSNILVRVRLSNAGGLVSGNNVRYAGIQVGTVKSVSLINDSTVEVTLLINKKVRQMIRKNAMVSVGTEGLIGNRIVNITPGQGPAGEIQDGDQLAGRKILSTEDMLATLAVSNNNIAAISEELKQTVRRINNSSALWKILSEEGLPADLRMSARNIRAASRKADEFMSQLQSLVDGVGQGKGSLGILLKDSSLTNQLRVTLSNMRQTTDQTNRAAGHLDSLLRSVNSTWREGNGTVQWLLKDSTATRLVSNTLMHIEQGTASFAADMEALKHNILLRGYFRRLEKRQAKP